VVRVVDASQEQPSLYDYDAVIVAAPVRGGAYPKAVQRWVDAHSAALNVRPTAFVSVCLGILQKSPTVDAELHRIVDTFLAATAWHPTVTKSVAGALLYTKYNWLIRWVMKRIAQDAGGDTDTSRDYEYTDWNDLRGFASAFSDTVQEHLVTPVGTGTISLSA
jgi:menaquinone-dependent protoporphyrinogen oxidase